MSNTLFGKKMTIYILLVFVFAIFSAGTFSEVYELRTHTTMSGKLDNLHSRFRDPTIRIFEKPGVRSLRYWVLVDEDKSQKPLM
ncbi:MAG: hypothetical protein ACI92E_001013 [Oceanicoccus sp.]|jgi:hypothetical protein